MLFLTIPTRNDHPELLNTIIEKSSIPRERVILIATAPNLSLPTGCIVIEDLEAPNIQRWWLKGIKEATRRGASAVAVLNDDLRINEETLPTLYRSLLETDAAVATPTRPDWGAAHYGSENLHPYTPVIWGCLWVLNTSSSLRPDPQYVWWYGDSDLDIRARRDLGGIITKDVYFEHVFPGEGTSNSQKLIDQTNLDSVVFETNHRNFLLQSRSTSPRKLFIQLQQFPGSKDTSDTYRTDFFEYVQSRADKFRDRVVLVEPNAALHAALRKLWQGWVNIVIVHQYVIPETGNDKQPIDCLMYQVDAKQFGFRQSRYKLEVCRLDPTATVLSVSLPSITLDQLIEDVVPGCIPESIAFDSNEYSLALALNLKQQPNEFIAQCSAEREIQLRHDAHKYGLYFLGRPWGEAHSSMSFSRKRKLSIPLFRTYLGHVVSSVVDQKKSLLASNTLSDFIDLKTKKRGSSSDLLDSSHGRSLSTISQAEINNLVEQVSGTRNSPDGCDIEWDFNIDTEEEVRDLVQECHSTHGVWPLSMSIPTWRELNSNPSELVSPIIPGYPYSFSDELAYVDRYAESYLAITHRKAGWDCFRHVEILSSGSVPLMPDANSIPTFSMVHYPKKALQSVMKFAELERGKPSWALRLKFREFFLSNLTTQRMAQYLLRVAGIPHDASVLFLDENLTHNPEYISTLTAIGIKENMGRNCVLFNECNFLYADSALETGHFYGRGFGYVKKLSPNLRSAWESEAQKNVSLEKSKLKEFDFVIIGSVTRNTSLTRYVLDNFPRQRTLLIHGEDSPPTLREARTLKSTNAQVFVRSIY